jgi:hypothetical protein
VQFVLRFTVTLRLGHGHELASTRTQHPRPRLTFAALMVKQGMKSMSRFSAMEGGLPHFQVTNVADISAETKNKN